MTRLAILIYLLVPWLASSCVSRGPKPPPAHQTVVPKVEPLGAIEKPSTENVTPLVSAQAHELSKVRSENERLKTTVGDSRRVGSRLELMLAKAIEEGQADRARLEAMEFVAAEDGILKARLTELTLGQAHTIEVLERNSKELDAEVGKLSRSVAVANQRLEDQEDQLETANGTIVTLTTQNEEAVKNASEWQSQADNAQGKIDTEKKWKWRFFWWGLGASVLIAAYLTLRLHPTTGRFVP